MVDLDKYLKDVGITFWEFNGVINGILELSLFTVGGFRIREEGVEYHSLVEYLKTHKVSGIHFDIYSK